jgi:general secretion pathway protein E
MKTRARRAGGGRDGFTLVEALAALAIASVIILASAALVHHVALFFDRAVPRLLDLGVEGFLLRSTLRAVIAQRLVRVLCDGCKSAHALTGPEIVADPRYRVLGFAAGETVYRPVGCERCGGTGYRGRAGIFELFEMTDEVRPFVSTQSDASLIDEAAIRAGMTTMLDDALEKCRAGMTAAPEILRVTSAR